MLLQLFSQVTPVLLHAFLPQTSSVKERTLTMV
jgi:hypothetical protein